MRFVLATLVLIAAGFFGSPAVADCTQPPGPNIDWSRCFLNGRDLSNHDFSSSRIAEASFQRANMAGVDLSKVKAYRAKFISALMPGARLDDGMFSDADFTKADLTGASLKNADLRRARFFGAVLKGADLTGSKIVRADFTGADLSGARWTDGERICAEASIGQCN